ncbi:SLAM family member 9-like [Brachyhypopomus gauderio]|uniref:SLAM family member 9-like n=1 Tax=Brachyhypopomus gauderio TaxID=698409 RepID=UPI004041A073
MDVLQRLHLSERGKFMGFPTTTTMLLLFVPSILVPFAVSADVFRQVGSSVQLNPEYHEQDFEVFLWLFHNKTIGKYYKDLSNIKVYPPYERRVEFNVKANSLTLKNLQRNDSGVYEAKTIGETNKIVSKYRLTVLEPTEPPVLSYGIGQQSSGGCNRTLTCRGHDLSITSTCYKESCNEKEVTSPGGITLTLTVTSGFVNCNFSNPISWKVADIEIKQLMQRCASHAKEEPAPDGTGHLRPATGIILVIILTVLCVMT